MKYPNSLSARFILLLVVQIFLATTLITNALGMNRFEPWDEQVFAVVEGQHGTAAAIRLRNAHNMLVENQGRPVQEKLEIVNTYMNSLPWISDSDLWNSDDYWATPFETIISYGGDCEDFAIAKYGLLRLLGIPESKLGFAYVLTPDKRRHIVLVYTDSPGTDSMVLDSQYPDVLPSVKRRDIIWIYVFKNDGTLYLIEDNGKDDRKLKSKLEDRHFAMWDNSKERARRFSDYYRRYNGGRPLMSDWIAVGQFGIEINGLYLKLRDVW